MDKPTLITVTYNTWETYTSRLIEQVFHYISPDDYTEWIMVDNNSEDADKIAKAMLSFPDGHREKFTLIRSDQNISDLPQYNRIIEDSVKTEKIVCISTDMRIFKITLPFFVEMLDWYVLVGQAGPFLPKGAEDEKVGGNWHWVPRLLVKRGIEFDHTAHVQTHMFGVLRTPFLKVGGFWEPEDKNYNDKGNLICSEIVLSLRLRQSGYRIGYTMPPCTHYGNQQKNMDEYDRKRGWDLGFRGRLECLEK